MRATTNSFVGWTLTLAVTTALILGTAWLFTKATNPTHTQASMASAKVTENAAQLQMQANQERVELERAITRQQAQLKQTQAAQWASFEHAWITPAWAVFQASIPAVGTLALWVLGGGLVLALVAAADAYYQRRHPLVWADSNNSLPVLRQHLAQLTANAVSLLEDQQHTKQLQALANAEAASRTVPHSLTYSPHITYQTKTEHSTAPTPSEEPTAAKPVQIPSFGELLTQGLIGPNAPLLLGFDIATGQPITGGFNSIYSLLIGGLSGSGKTTSQRHLAAMLALKGCKFVVCDPHGESGEESLAGTLAPLAGSYLCNVAVEDTEILAAVRLVAEIGERRIRGKDESRQLVMLWVDEITSLLQKEQLGRELGALIEEIARQYRKVGVFCSASGQNWSAVRSGGNSALRESFASVLCHRLRRTSARMLVPAGEAALIERLPAGRALLWRATGEATVIAVPNCTHADIEGVAQLLRLQTTDCGYQSATDWLPSRLPTDPEGWIEVSQNGSHHKPEVATESTDTISPEARRAAELFMNGATPAEVVATLKGVKSSQGATYQRALEEILDLIRQGVVAIATERAA